MPVLDADVLNADPQGLEFLRDVLGTRAETASPERRFPLEAWTPKPPVSSAGSSPAAAPAPELIKPRFADALA
jgi:hypothetical protein